MDVRKHIMNRTQIEENIVMTVLAKRGQGRAQTASQRMLHPGTKARAESHPRHPVNCYYACSG